MKQLATFLLLITSLTAFGQSSIELPFNPDADGNGFISVSDVLNVLSTYDTMFSAGEVLVNGTGLSSFIAETDSTIDSLSAAASVCIELQHLEAFEEYLNNSTSCWITYDGTSSCCSINIPNSCRQLTLFMWNSASATQTQVPLRLPTEGEFPGQIIEIRITEAGEVSGTIDIEAYQGNEWVVVGTLMDAPNQHPFQGTSREYLSSEMQNEKFIWDGSSWQNVALTIMELNWTSID